MKNLIQLDLNALVAVVGGANGCYSTGPLPFGIEISIGKCELK